MVPNIRHTELSPGCSDAPGLLHVHEKPEIRSPTPLRRGQAPPAEKLARRHSEGSQHGARQPTIGSGVRLIAPATPVTIVTVWPVAITVIGPGIAVPIIRVAIAVIATAIVSPVITNLFDGRIVFRLSWRSSNTWHHRGLGFRSDNANGNQHHRGHRSRD